MAMAVRASFLSFSPNRAEPFFIRFFIPLLCRGSYQTASPSSVISIPSLRHSSEYYFYLYLTLCSFCMFHLNVILGSGDSLREERIRSWFNAVFHDRSLMDSDRKKWLSNSAGVDYRVLFGHEGEVLCTFIHHFTSDWDQWKETSFELKG